MNRSFFLGLLADRLVELGEENFRNKYNFQASDHLNHKIDGFIKTGILEATQKQILNG
jgi:hypothetical protein